ncbi:MAG: hypothetical protein AAF631_11025 [Pseudomonadota bacterium]
MRIIFALFALAFLAACEAPSQGFTALQPQTVRPGLTADQAQRVARVPNGLRRSWQFVGNGIAGLSPELEVRLRRSGAEVRWTGNLKFPLPSTNVREIARQIEAATGRKAPVQGNFALIPVRAASDRAGRLTRFDAFGTATVYAPHDCQNTLGQCSSTWADSSGRAVRVIVDTTEEGGRWFATIRLDPRFNGGSRRVIERRVYSIDRYGIFKDAHTLNLTDGSRPFFLRAK